MLDKSENTTKYGEEVCSEFAWLPLDKQKNKIMIKCSHTKYVGENLL